MLTRSVLANWVTLLLAGLTSFLLTPFLVRHLGDVYYGIWILVGAFIDYYGLLDLGISQTLQRYVAVRWGGSERAALNRTLAAALAISCGIGVALCVVTGVLMVALPDFLGLTGTAKSVFRQVLLMVGVAVGVTFPARTLGAYLQGLQRFDLYNFAASLNILLRAVLIVVVVQQGWALLGVAAVTLGMALVSVAVHWHLVRRADPALVVAGRLANWKDVKELFHFSFYVFVAMVGDYFRFHMDSFVIARMLTVALVTPFSVAARLISYFVSVVVAASGPLTTKFAHLHGQGKENELRETFVRATSYTALLSIFLGSHLLFNGQTLLRLWLGERFAASYSLLVILATSYVCALAQIPSLSLLYALGRHRPLAAWTLVEGLLNLGLSIYWARLLGLEGVALGTALPMIATKLLIQPWYVLNVLRMSPRQYVFRCFCRPLGVGASFALIVVLLKDEVTTAPASFATTLLWQSTLFSLLSYLIVFVGSERQYLGAGLKRMAEGLQQPRRLGRS